MNDVCIWKPTVSTSKMVDGRLTKVELESDLWKDIQSFTSNDRLKSKWLYALLKSSFTKYLKGVLFDEFGEVIFDSVKDRYNFSAILDSEQKLELLLLSYGFHDKDGNPVEFDNILEVLDKVNQFNRESKDNRCVIKNGTLRGKFGVDVLSSVGDGMDYVKSSLAFSSQLNKNILNFLNDLGFNITFGDMGNPKFNGLFMPENLRLAINGLINIIKVADNQKGYDSIPEEFAHLLILGLNHTPLVQKMLDSIKTLFNGEYSVIQKILGDTFGSYKALYSDGGQVDWDLMARESAGKLLVKALNGESLSMEDFNDNSYHTAAPITFAKRVLNYIMNLFKITRVKDVEDFVIDALRKANFISDLFVNNRDDLLDIIKKSGINDILNSKNMYETEKTLTNLELLLIKGLNLLRYTYDRDRNAIFKGDFSSLHYNIQNESDAKELNEIEHYYNEWQNNPNDYNKYKTFEDKINEIMNVRYVSIKSILSDSEATPFLGLLNLIEPIVQNLSSLRFVSNKIRLEFSNVDGSDMNKMRMIAEQLTYIKKVSSALSDLVSDINSIRDTDEYKNIEAFLNKTTEETLLQIDEDIMNLTTCIGGFISSLDSVYKTVSKDLLVKMVKLYLPNGYDVKTYDAQTFIVDEKNIVKSLDVDEDGKTVSKITVKNKKGQEFVVTEKQIEDIIDDNGQVYKGKKRVFVDGGQIVHISPEDIVEIANAAPSLFDQTVKGMYQCSDHFLNILSNIFTEQQELGRALLVNIERSIRGLQLLLEQSGSDTKFMFEYGEDGVKTGRYISLYNFDRWYKDRAEAIERFRNEKKDKWRFELVLWDSKHSKLLNPDDPNSLMPNVDYEENGLKIYKSNALDGLTAAQREYYDLFMALKMNFDALYPKGTTHLYSCIQISKSSSEKQIETIKDFNIGRTFRNIKDSISEFYTIKDDDSDYNLGLRVDLGIDGKPINRVPVKYTCNIHDAMRKSKLYREQLTDDCSSALLAYVAAGTNYRVCDDLINQFIIAEDYIRNVREVKSDLKYFISKDMLTKGLKKQWNKDEGLRNAAADIVKNFRESNMEGNRKNLETWRIGKYEINYGAILDSLRMFTTIYRLSFNPVTGIMNGVDEETLAFIECSHGEFFDKASYLRAEGVGFGMTFDHIFQAGSANPNDMMTLIASTFDLNDDYLDSLREGNIKNNSYERIMGIPITHLFMHLGELHNHIIPGLAHLMHLKCKDANGNEVSFFDSLEILEVYTGSTIGKRLVLKPGTTLTIKSNRFEGGLKEFKFDRPIGEYSTGNSAIEKLWNDYFGQIAECFSVVTANIKNVNRRMNGAMNSVDNGLIMRHSIGRAILQFRRWQIAYMTNRFGNDFINSNGEIQKAYWRFGSSFMFDMVKNCYLRHFKGIEEARINHGYEWKNLNAKEKGYIKRCFAETGLLFIGLMASAWLGGDWDYEEGEKRKHPYDGTEWQGIGRFIYMLTIRGSLELSASVPSLSMISSFLKIFDDPIPCLENIALMLKFISPTYISRHVGKEAKHDRFGVTDDYTLKLLSYVFPLLRQYWNFYDLIFTNEDDLFRWFYTDD